MRGAPIPPEEYARDTEPGDPVLTDDELAAGGWAAGLDVWEQMGKAYEHYLNPPGGRADYPDGLDNAQMWSLQEAIKAYPRRDDPVAAWIKRARDTYVHRPDGTAQEGWHALDHLLDDYREHADTGVPLADEVQGPHGEAGR